MPLTHGLRVFTEWHYFEILERLRESEKVIEAAFWTTFSTFELTEIVLYGKIEELCLCEECGKPNASAGVGSCWISQILQELASKAQIKLGFKKIIFESSNMMPGIEKVQETFSNVTEFEDAHVVWVNFIMLDSRGHSIPSARRSIFCFGNLMRER